MLGECLALGNTGLRCWRLIYRRHDANGAIWTLGHNKPRHLGHLGHLGGRRVSGPWANTNKLNKYKIIIIQL